MPDTSWTLFNLTIEHLFVIMNYINSAKTMPPTSLSQLNNIRPTLYIPVSEFRSAHSHFRCPNIDYRYSNFLIDHPIRSRRPSVFGNPVLFRSGDGSEMPSVLLKDARCPSGRGTGGYSFLHRNTNFLLKINQAPALFTVEDAENSSRCEDWHGVMF